MVQSELVITSIAAIHALRSNTSCCLSESFTDEILYRVSDMKKAKSKNYYKVLF